MKILKCVCAAYEYHYSSSEWQNIKTSSFSVDATQHAFLVFISQDEFYALV